VTNDSSARRNGQDAVEPSATGSVPHIEARWLKPLVPRTGGEAVLLVRVVAPAVTQHDRQAPLDVALVLDRSGSMANGKLDLAKEGVDLAVSRLRSVDRVALVIYDDAVEVLQPLQTATPRAKATLRLVLHGVDPGGSTNLSGGWTAGCTQLATAPALEDDGGATRIRRVILLTDGLANVGIIAPHELSQHAGQLCRRGIATTTVGVGQDFDEGLLSAMAEAGGGNFQYVADPKALREFFSHELQELFSVAATGLEVVLTVPTAVTANLIAAFPTQSCEQRLQVAIGDLVAGDEIDLVCALQAAPGDSDEAIPVNVLASWTDPRVDQHHEFDASPRALHRADQSECDRSPADPFVEERAALQRAAAERRAGLELDRLGHFAESRARMHRSRQYLMAAPMTMGVRFALSESESLAAAPATSPLTAHARKLAQFHEEQRRRGRYMRAAPDDDGDR
jgi:Ca-activated chloride channel homolog